MKIGANLLRKERPQDVVISKSDVQDFMRHMKREQAVFPQLTLAYRYNLGLGGLE